MDDNKPTAKNNARDAANEAAAEKQREIQREQDRKEPSEGSGGEKKGAVQTGSRSYPDQLDQAVAALDVQLTTEEVRALEAPYEPHPVLGHA